ncbi:MAG: hypothetical protein KKG04_04925 [Candidatus Thermoplasmatota archaeon]|nr:hypothetical protein [Candidatus Thermoplasmatota archaeon]
METMEIYFLEDTIKIKNKKLLNLDKFVLDFTSILFQEKIAYVLVSGYISMLFGRNRTSEDVDILVTKLDFKNFEKVWIEITKKYDCIITSDRKDAYENYLLKDTAIRFAKKETFIPNMECKFPKFEIDHWTLKERKKVTIGNHELFISPLEIQIPYKLFLGSEKDIEDAKFLFNLFKNNIDHDLFDEFNKKLKTQGLFNRYIK